MEWSDLWTPARRLGAAGLAVGFAAYLLFVALKALRFAAFLKLPFSRALYGVVCAQTFWSNILPMRLGDLSYIPLLKDRMGEPIDRGAASFLLAGLADAWMRLALSAGLGAYFSARIESPALRILTWMSVVGCAAASAAVPLARLNWRVDRFPFLGKTARPAAEGAAAADARAAFGEGRALLGAVFGGAFRLSAVSALGDVSRPVRGAGAFCDDVHRAGESAADTGFRRNWGGGAAMGMGVVACRIGREDRNFIGAGAACRRAVIRRGRGRPVAVDGAHGFIKRRRRMSAPHESILTYQ